MKSSRPKNPQTDDCFQLLYAAFIKAHPTMARQDAQKKVIELWKETKNRYQDNKQEFKSSINKMIEDFKCQATKAKSMTITRFFSKVPPQKPQSPENEPNVQDISMPSTSKSNEVSPPMPDTSKDNEVSSTVVQDDDSPVKTGAKRKVVPLPDEDEEDPDDPTEVLKIKRECPAQDKLRAKIALLESQLNAAIMARDSGFGGPDAQSTVETLRAQVDQNKKALDKLSSNRKRQQKFRYDRKNAMQKWISSDKEAAKALKVRNDPGRPRLEVDQPELLRVISEIAKFGGTADPRRRSEQIRAVKTLDDLHEELKLKGFELSRSATYLRLLPRRSDTTEGKRHVCTVPVKLCRAQTDQRKAHPDQKFCLASIRSIETLASILGSRQAAVLSQDDKARVPIGITAANKQAPLLMHVEYKVSLPDHDWVVAPRHKLIPSVYAGVGIDDDADKIGRPEAVGYSGPTYIAIRSGKHSSSSADTHAQDLDRLMTLSCFEKTMKVDGEAKPVLIVTVDGGPDENPRYPKVISNGITTFKKYNLDAMYIVTNAPGHSAYNRVERRMAPASNELRGVVLPHEHFGSHLNNNGDTIDKELVVKNFQHAGTVLADIWGKMIIDGYPVVAEYIPPDHAAAAQISETVSAEWYLNHVRESQYFLQIVKCKDGDCCSPMRSNLKNLLPNGFFPAPYPLRRTSQGLVVPKPEDTTTDDKFAPFSVRQSLSIYPENDRSVPYDRYCPSLQSQIADRTCPKCGLYFATKKNMKLHSKEVHGRAAAAAQKLRPKKILAKRDSELLCETADNTTDARDLEWQDVDDVDTEGLSIPPLSETRAAPASVIGDVSSWLQSP